MIPSSDYRNISLPASSGGTPQYVTIEIDQDSLGYAPVTPRFYCHFQTSGELITPYLNFQKEYGEDVIDMYAGCFADELTVRNSEDVINKSKRFKEDADYRNRIISYLRTYLSFMDVRCFARNVYNVISD